MIDCSNTRFHRVGLVDAMLHEGCVMPVAGLADKIVDALDDGASESVLAKYRNAIRWAFDYFSTDNLTDLEINQGCKRLAKFLSGDLTGIGDHVPGSFEESYFSALCAEIQTRKHADSST